MKAKKLFFNECHLAGRKYHDADEVWDELKVGTTLRLEAEPENRYDSTAVQVIYDSVEKQDSFLLGYIPRDENSTIFGLLDMGWNEIFECRISKIDSEAHYENQISLTLRIKKNGDSLAKQ